MLIQTKQPDPFHVILMHLFYIERILSYPARCSFTTIWILFYPAVLITDPVSLIKINFHMKVSIFIFLSQLLGITDKVKVFIRTVINSLHRSIDSVDHLIWTPNHQVKLKYSSVSKTRLTILLAMRRFRYPSQWAYTALPQLHDLNISVNGTVVTNKM
jgi:hypothetical protein